MTDSPNDQLTVQDEVPMQMQDQDSAMATPDAATLEEERNSSKVTLADLCAKGTASYAQKHYEEARDFYADASGLQAEIRGELDPQNADVLFLYGRALFKVGQAKSDVLGGTAGGATKAQERKANGNSKGKPATKEEVKSEGIAEGVKPEVKEQNGEDKKEGATDTKKPLFQFTGDENFEDSEEEEAVEAGEGEDAEEEDDDLENAFEILDLSRVLFTKRLEFGSGEAEGDAAMTRHIKERLAETHELLAEISLENERFPAAVADFRSALSYKNDLHTEESEFIAEAHYMLSLALEFASITRSKDEAGGESKTEEEAAGQIDQGMRDEAASELEAAVKSTKMKLSAKEVEFASTSSPDDNDITRKQIADVKENLVDMETRLKDLKGPPIDVKAAVYGPAGGAALSGVLGATIGESPADAEARIEEAKKHATDLTGIVRKKAKADTDVKDTNGAGAKRKAENDVVDTDGPKKAKVEDAPEE